MGSDSQAGDAARDRELLAAERRARAEYTAGNDHSARWARVAVAVAAVAAVSGLIAMLVTGRGASDEEFQRAAAERVNVLLSVAPGQPGQPDRAKRVLAGATGEFHDEFAQSADAYTAFVRAAGTVSDGRVQGTGLTARRGKQAEVLVYATVDLAPTAQSPSRSADFRLRVVVADEDGDLKLAMVQYLP